MLCQLADDFFFEDVFDSQGDYALAGSFKKGVYLLLI